MDVIGFVGIGVGVLGTLFGARCYLELWRWARQCQHARIAVAYKRKVQLQAPLVEWLLWCNNLKKDKASTGRVVYSRAGVSVALTKATIPPGRVRSAIRAVRARRAARPPKVVEGGWSARDESKPSVDRVAEELRQRG